MNCTVLFYQMYGVKLFWQSYVDIKRSILDIKNHLITNRYHLLPFITISIYNQIITLEHE
jgi:hypothetical protein